MKENRNPIVPFQKLWIAFVPYIVMSVIHVWALFAGSSIAPPTKLLLMPLLAMAVVVLAVGVIGLHKGTVLLLVLGIFFSWLGDGSATFFPFFEDELPMMLLNFGIAHLLYMYIFWRSPGIGQSIVKPNGKKQFVTWWALAYVPVYVLLVSIIAPAAGALGIPVAFYAVVLTGTAMLALRAGGIVALGGFWFLVSDAILGFRIFVPEAMPWFSGGLVMLTYTLGQGLIAYGVMKKARVFAAEKLSPSYS